MRVASHPWDCRSPACAVPTAYRRDELSLARTDDKAGNYSK